MTILSRNDQNGRSMIEMLGVLAIIGVLSIGGIAGYTLAMNRYRANELLDTAAKVAVVAMTKNGGIGDNANTIDIRVTQIATELKPDYVTRTSILPFVKTL